MYEDNDSTSYFNLLPIKADTFRIMRVLVAKHVSISLEMVASQKNPIECIYELIQLVFTKLFSI